MVVVADRDQPGARCRDGGRQVDGSGQGEDVAYALATAGEAGIDSTKPEDAVVSREAEERVLSAGVVGVDSVTFLGHPDGMLPSTASTCGETWQRARPAATASELLLSINHPRGRDHRRWGD